MAGCLAGRPWGPGSAQERRPGCRPSWVSAVGNRVSQDSSLGTREERRVLSKAVQRDF